MMMMMYNTPNVQDECPGAVLMPSKALYLSIYGIYYLPFLPQRGIATQKLYTEISPADIVDHTPQ